MSDEINALKSSYEVGSGLRGRRLFIIGFTSPLPMGGSLIINHESNGTGIGANIPIMPGIDLQISHPIGGKMSFFLEC